MRDNSHDEDRDGADKGEVLPSRPTTITEEATCLDRLALLVLFCLCVAIVVMALSSR